MDGRSTLWHKKFRALANDITALCGEGRLNTLQFVSYSPPDAIASTLPLQWLTLSASPQAYGMALRQFTSVEDLASDKIMRTLVHDDYDEGPFWHYSHIPKTDPIPLPGLGELDQIQLQEGALSETPDPTKPPYRLELWKLCLEGNFGQSPFTAMWVPQAHYDPSNEIMRSHVFALFYDLDSSTLPLYPIAKKCRDFTVDYISQYFAFFEQSLRARRLEEVAEALNRSVGLMLILDESSSAAAEVFEMAKRTELPLTIIGETGSGKTTTARHFCQLYLDTVAPESRGQMLRIPCYNEREALRKLREVTQSTGPQSPIILDDIHLASERLWERLIAFLTDRREASAALLGAGARGAPVVVTADSATPALAALGHFPSTLWRLVSTLRLNTRAFHEMPAEEQGQIINVIVKNVCDVLEKGDDLANYVIAKIESTPGIYSLNDLTDTTIRIIRSNLERDPK